MRTLTMTLALAISLACSGTTYAQTPGPNGGAVYTKGEHGVEVLVRGQEVTVYLLHDGKAGPTKGYALKGLAQQGGKTIALDLKDVEGKRLVGKLPAALEAGAIVVITGKDEHGDAVSVRHVVK